MAPKKADIEDSLFAHLDKELVKEIVLKYLSRFKSITFTVDSKKYSGHFITIRLSNPPIHMREFEFCIYVGNDTSIGEIYGKLYYRVANIYDKKTLDEVFQKQLRRILSL